MGQLGIWTNLWNDPGFGKVKIKFGRPSRSATTKNQKLENAIDSMIEEQENPDL
jgi:hypothetical protein